MRYDRVGLNDHAIILLFILQRNNLEAKNVVSCNRPIRIIGILSFALVFTNWANAQIEEQYNQQDSKASKLRDVAFVTPSQIFAGQKQTEVTLQAVEVINDFNGGRMRHHSYNGDLVGPIIRVKPGARLKVHLQNNLPLEQNNSGHQENSPHGLNTTNLHTHGLHVSPKSPADDVLFTAIPPTKDADFVFDIPANHPAGTFWYHPHKHGSTAFQLASGMSGALIVEGGLDDIQAIKDAKEKIMVLQQFRAIQESPGLVAITRESVYGGEGSLIQAINGIVTPTIVMRPGEIQRWRLIHAGTDDAINLDLEGIQFREIAVDGLATGRMELKKGLVLYPGYRSDVLVQAPVAAGTRLLYTTIRDPSKSIRNEVMDRTNLLRLVIEGEPVTMSFPSQEQLASAAAFRPEDIPLDKQLTGTPRQIVFNMGPDFFHINDKSFSSVRIDQEVTLGTAEEWLLSSRRGVHPFHIHVNPFAVKPTVAGAPWVWRDTYVVTREQPVTMRTWYRQHPGDTVLHCHNLLHEDQGMMQRIRINEGPVATNSTSSEIAVETVAKDWSGLDRSGKRLTSEMYRGRKLLLVLHRGIQCIHCADQLSRLSREHEKLLSNGIATVAVSRSLPEGQEAEGLLSAIPFPILLDMDGTLFKDFDCFNATGEDLHGLFLFDSDSKCLRAIRTETAVEDPIDWAIHGLTSNLSGETK